MMKFEFLPDTAGLGWLKRFIQGRDIVSIQVVAYKDNLVRIGKILVHKLLDFLRPVRLAAMLSDGDSSPALMGCREHETAASTVADVFVVNLFRMVFIGSHTKKNRSRGLEYTSRTSSIWATNEAFWSGGIHHIFLK